MRTEALSDVEIAAVTARCVAVPREAPADSFVLHAPLELAARLGLLPWVRPERRGAALRRIMEIGNGVEAVGPPVQPAAMLTVDDPVDAAGRLVGALRAGDLDGVDTAAAALARCCSATELPGLLVEAVLPSLAAAGHAPIFFHLLPRVAPRGELPVELLRPLVRELARNPNWSLTWFRARRFDGDPDLERSLVELPLLGVPGSVSIYPLMEQVETSGVAARHLGSAVRQTPIKDGARIVLRLAARSMLLEPPDHAPYGWSHALTMPQGALAAAPHCTDPRTALAMAATFLAGFRVALGTVDLRASYEPEPPRGDLRRALTDAPRTAAAAVWHADPADHRDLAATLAGEAAGHRDAHVVKYTLACLDAAAADPAAARLYLAAAARLLGFWVEHPDTALPG
ncbi:MAG: hypothetical protein AB7W59_14460 [Acidimicrobiia bacterium]